MIDIPIDIPIESIENPTEKSHMIDIPIDIPIES